MKIKKINNDKLKVVLSIDDLDEKNIDIDSFLSNPIEAQNLFLEILDLAEEKYNFNIENNKAVVETISLDDNHVFIITITRLQNYSCSYDSYLNAYCFENINDLFSFFSSISKESLSIAKSSIYQLENKYYFLLNEKNKFLENSLLEFTYTLNNFSLLENILVEYGNKIN